MLGCHPGAISKSELGGKYGISISDVVGIQFYLEQTQWLVMGPLRFELVEESTTKRNLTDEGKGNFEIVNTQKTSVIEVPLGTPGICINAYQIYPRDILVIDFGDGIILDFVSYPVEDKFYLEQKDIFVNGQKYSYPKESGKYYLKGSSNINTKRNVETEKKVIKGKTIK
jgi:hypothetical protein